MRSSFFQFVPLSFVFFDSFGLNVLKLFNTRFKKMCKIPIDLSIPFCPLLSNYVIFGPILLKFFEQKSDLWTSLVFRFLSVFWQITGCGRLAGAQTLTKTLAHFGTFESTVISKTSFREIIFRSELTPPYNGQLFACDAYYPYTKHSMDQQNTANLLIPHYRALNYQFTKLQKYRNT